MKKGILAGMAAVMLITGCGPFGSAAGNGTAGWRDDVSAEALADAVADELGEAYWADARLAPERLDDWYGISDDMYEEYYGQIPVSSEHVDSLIIVKAESERLEDVQNALDTYREAMIQDTLQEPSNISKIQASMIRTYGDYVCFVQLGGSLEEAEGDTEKAIETCREMNERALSVIEKELTK